MTKELGLRYNKLVRDRIPELMQKDGKVVRFHVANHIEYWRALQDKLLEEVSEFLKDPNAEELADIVEVIEALVRAGIIDEKSVIDKISEKAEQKGRFKQRFILDEVKDV